MPPGARTQVPKPSDFPQYEMTDYEEVNIITPDGESLHGYLVRPGNRSIAKPVTFLSFHGNAGNVGHRLPIAGIITSNMGCNILMVEYRGYGKSTGTPDETGLNIDAQTALDYLRQHKDTKGTKIVVYGQSLGGAVGIQLVAKNQEQKDIKALILENTFTSIRQLIPRYARLKIHTPSSKKTVGDPNIDAVLSHRQDFSHLSVTSCGQARRLFPRSQKFRFCFSAVSKTRSCRKSVLHLQPYVNLTDVRPSHMKTLFEKCGAYKKIWRDFPDGTHNDTVAAPGYFQAIADFCQDYVGKG